MSEPVPEHWMVELAKRYTPVPLSELVYHDDEACTPPCCIHSPSDHPLSTAKLQWRPDRRIMERVCAHGVGHPDVDDLRFQQANGGDDSGVHGCDGCCR